ncbi:MAG: bifunctional phosphoglucose/phosphomannose isomerase [Candidatus Omnitrophica bacterium]|nr:bifunctional phosphoglucose/phosphomannose isomerase [Candidatus Omnitrophota bacterium]
MTDLENLDQIRLLDSGDFLDLILKFPAQLQEALKNKFELRKPSTAISSIVLSGVGGSAIGAEFVRSRLIYSCPIPITVLRHYRLPQFVNSSTLVIACSYSGDTEETLAAVDEAVRKKAKLVTVTSGGCLARMAEEKGFDCVRIPSGYPPRAAMGFSIISILSILEKFGITSSTKLEAEESISLLERLAGDEYGVSIPETKNPAKQLARLIQGKYPIIYASTDYMEAVALRWREQIEENAKTLAGHYLFPEMTHNEIVGWHEPKHLLNQFAAIFLLDPSHDHPRIKHRFNYSKTVIQKTGASVVDLTARGNSPLARMFSLAYLSDFVSFYLAMLNDVDPTPIQVIDTLKKELIKQ